MFSLAVYWRNQSSILWALKVCDPSEIEVMFSEGRHAWKPNSHSSSQQDPISVCETENPEAEGNTPAVSLLRDILNLIQNIWILVLATLKFCIWCCV